MTTAIETEPSTASARPSSSNEEPSARGGRFQPARLALREESASDEEVLSSLMQGLGVSRLLARILACRGIHTADAARAFLSPTLKDHLPDPRQIKNIEQAAELILDSVEAREPITIYCDFDVDGLSSGAQLVLFLQQLGAIVSVYTPNRFTEGYGLVESAIEKIVRTGTKLLITLDCGITSHREITLARRRGMKTIVVDHHVPGELPPADVVVDPAQEGCPFREHALAAAGLTLMLLIVLRQKARERLGEELEKGAVSLPDPKDFLDLAALGTICDMVPLRGLNRVIAHRGVEALKQTQRPGLIALKRTAGIPDHRLSAGSVAFGIGPRINAAGRLDDASEIIELLTTASEARATAVASAVDRLNTRRRGIEQDVLETCLRQVKSDSAFRDAPAILMFDPSFHIGVIGIVAQRLVEQFYRPAVVMAPGDSLVNGKSVPVIKGSVRSIPGFHIAEVLGSLREHLLNGGGHAAAGGFSLLPDKLSAFQEAFLSIAREQLQRDLLTRQVLADVHAELGEVDFEFVQALSALGPFGVGNPTPLLVSQSLTIEWAQSVAGDHIKLRVGDGRFFANAMAWRFRGHPLLKKGERVNIAYSPEINTYQGVASVQLNIKEVWSS